MTALLELDEVEAGYGPFRAIFGVSLEIQPGEAVAMLGANGAGKTTIARVCSGLIRPTAGSFRYSGREASQLGAYRLAKAGVAHAPEGRSVFATLTVEENLALSFRQEMGRDFRAGIDQACEMFPRLGERRRQLAGTLSGGEQRMLALARALVIKPRLLVADELSLGLAPVTVEEVYRTLARIKEEGTAILVIEQHVHHALALADQAVVLRHGEVSHRGTSTEVGALSEQLLPSGNGGGGAPATPGDELDAADGPLGPSEAVSDAPAATTGSAGSPPADAAEPPLRRRRPLIADRRAQPGTELA
ncbi:MAG TPA: ABC transporter ATP-binding protein [Acidimicrobiales bacterium]|jgi:branched-chain amino acid transport system ATP-binding protein|nr:ABC transporter ATP-binding protein [Acidimicrobiales bacterium]